MSDARTHAIQHRLAAAFGADGLAVRDDSHLHIGHAGARDGRGHFSVRGVSPAFAGTPALARHRAVYAALGDLMASDIHALSIDALTPAEAGQPEGNKP